MNNDGLSAIQEASDENEQASNSEEEEKNEILHIPTVFVVLDKSGSMKEHTDDVISGYADMKQNILTKLENANSVETAKVVIILFNNESASYMVKRKPDTNELNFPLLVSPNTIRNLNFQVEQQNRRPNAEKTFQECFNNPRDMFEFYNILVFEAERGTALCDALMDNVCGENLTYANETGNQVFIFSDGDSLSDRDDSQQYVQQRNTYLEANRQWKFENIRYAEPNVQHQNLQNVSSYNLGISKFSSIVTVDIGKSISSIGDLQSLVVAVKDKPKKEKKIQQLIKDEDACRICYKPHLEWLRLPCKHRLGQECREKMEKKNECPYCRQKFEDHEVEMVLGLTKYGEDQDFIKNQLKKLQKKQNFGLRNFSTFQQAINFQVPKNKKKIKKQQKNQFILQIKNNQGKKLGSQKKEKMTNEMKQIFQKFDDILKKRKAKNDHNKKDSKNKKFKK